MVKTVVCSYLPILFDTEKVPIRENKKLAATST